MKEKRTRRVFATDAERHAAKLERTRAWRARNKEGIAIYQRAYRSERIDTVTAKEKAYRVVNAERLRARYRAYEASNPGRKAGNQLSRYLETKQYRQKNPWKYAAHKAVIIAKRKGLLSSEPCRACGAIDVQAHHSSYLPEDWLKVSWLCGIHHAAWHRLFDPELPTETYEQWKARKERERSS